MKKSSYAIEVRPEYNPFTNLLELSFVLLDANGSYSGNFSLKYDNELFRFVSVTENKLDNGNVVAGAPIGVDNMLTCAFSLPDGVTADQCDEDGNLTIAQFYLDVTRKKAIGTTEISAGATYFYEKDEAVFIEPVSISLDDEFFFMLGDADNNRYINAADARIILRIAAKLETVTDEAMFIRCDVNKDGKITAADARLVLRYSAQLIDSFDEETTDEDTDIPDIDVTI